MLRTASCRSRNSTEGAVSMTSDALLDGQLLIRQEYILPVSHCLLTRASSSLEHRNGVFASTSACTNAGFGSRSTCPARRSCRPPPRRRPHVKPRPTTAQPPSARPSPPRFTTSRSSAETSRIALKTPRASWSSATVTLKPTGRDRTTLAFGVTHHEGCAPPRPHRVRDRRRQPHAHRVAPQPPEARGSTCFSSTWKAIATAPSSRKRSRGARRSATFVEGHRQLPRSDTPAPNGKPASKKRGRCAGASG